MYQNIEMVPLCCNSVMFSFIEGHLKLQGQFFFSEATILGNSTNIYFVRFEKKEKLARESVRIVISDIYKI